MPLTNGGFETGDFTGWTESGGWTFGPPAVVNTLDVRSGTYSCWMGTRYNPGLGLDDDSIVSQVFSTEAGKEYTVTVYMCVPTLLPDRSAAADVSLSLIDVSTGSTLEFNAIAQDTIPVGVFIARTITATATGSSTRFRVAMGNSGAAQGTWYAMLDDCSVSEGADVAIRLSERAVDEVVSILQTNLETEITAIETDRADSLNIPVPASTDYHKYDKAEIAGSTVHVSVYEDSFEILNPYTDQDTQRAVTEIPLTVRVTFFRRAGETAEQMNTLRRRYATAVLNTLIVNTTYSDDAVQRILLDGVRFAEDYAEDGTLAKVQVSLSALVKMEESYA